MAGESSSGNIEDRFDSSVVEPRKKGKSSRAALEKVKGKSGPSGVKFPRHPRNSASMVEELYDKYGVDKTEYRLVYEKFVSPTAEKAERYFYGDPAYVAFFFKQFQLGLRLPLDPFINEFLETYDIVPAHIGANAVRYLTSFIVLCRCIGFEPCMAAFDHFFSVNFLEASRSISIKMDSHKPKIISPISSTVNKVSGWNRHVIYVESRLGWEFSFPTRRPHKAKIVHKPSWSKALIRRLEDFAAVGTLSWAELEADSSYYVLAGLMKGVEGGIQPRVLIKRGHRFPDWVVHPEFVFTSECPRCRADDGCCLRERDIVGRKFIFLP